MEKYFELKTAQTENRDDDVIENDDGSAVIKLDDRRPSSGKFYANLAEDLEESVLNELGMELHELIMSDREARAKRDEQYEEGIRRTGLGDDAPGGAQFMGASKVVHPMLTEACVDFASRAMKEIFPASGPAKAFIIGDPEKRDVERSERVAEFLNYQALVEIPEMRSELEQMATQLPLGGGQYIKLNWDHQKKRPTVLFVAIDDIFLPYAATNFYTAERKTHVQYITRQEFSQRVKSKMYRDLELIDSLMPDTSKAEMASNKVEGREIDADNADGLRMIYECFCTWNIEEEDRYDPYIVSIDAASKRVLSVYRNWKKEDEKREALDWLVEFAFVPWRGAYPIGISQMMGGISAAATGALRALLDSALINNFPGLLKLKGGSSGGQTERIDPTQIMEVEGSIQDDDVRKLVMPMPYSPPSQVLFSLLGFLVDSGKQLLRTTLEETADNNQNVPVGTTMARLEQGMTVYSAIHARLCHSMQKLLDVLFRIDCANITEKEIFSKTGKLLIRKEDLQGHSSVVPVSDPNIFSESQRFAQIQLIAQRAQMMPQVYDVRKVEELILERMKIQNAKELLLPRQDGAETNAINENIAASLGRPVVAFAEQDHMAHMQVHLEFMTNPALGQSKIIAPMALPILIEHLKEHMLLYYGSSVFDEASQAARIPIDELQRKATKEERQVFDQMLAEASAIVCPQVEKVFQQIPAVIENCQQFLAQGAQQPQDPAMQLGMAEIQSKEKIEAGRISLEQNKMQQNLQVEQLKLTHSKEMADAAAQAKEREAALRAELEQLKLESRMRETESKLAMQQKQAEQVLDMEAMKQENENLRTAAKLDTDLTKQELQLGATQSLAETRAEQDALARSEAHQHALELDAAGQEAGLLRSFQEAALKDAAEKSAVARNELAADKANKSAAAARKRPKK